MSALFTLSLADVDELHDRQHTVVLKTALLAAVWDGYESYAVTHPELSISSTLYEALQALVREIAAAADGIEVVMDRAKKGGPGDGPQAGGLAD